MRRVNCLPMKASPDRSAYHYFFGYYDKNPWDSSERRILAHRTTFADRFPESTDRAEIGYICPGAEPDFVKIAQTTAWNWQQGAQLQWLQNTHSGQEQIIFNHRRKDHLVAVIMSPSSGEQRVLDTPIHTVSPSATCALSLNYARLFDTRKDYGISGLQNRSRDIERPEDDGIYILDLESGTSKLLVSIAVAADVAPNCRCQSAHHWVNHMMFNPSGTRFCFLHRFWREDRILLI